MSSCMSLLPLVPIASFHTLDSSPFGPHPCSGIDEFYFYPSWGEGVGGLAAPLPRILPPFGLNTSSFCLHFLFLFCPIEFLFQPRRYYFTF